MDPALNRFQSPDHHQINTSASHRSPKTFHVERVVGRDQRRCEISRRSRMQRSFVVAQKLHPLHRSSARAVTPRGMDEPRHLGSRRWSFSPFPIAERQASAPKPPSPGPLVWTSQRHHPVLPSPSSPPSFKREIIFEGSGDWK